MKQRFSWRRCLHCIFFAGVLSGGALVSALEWPLPALLRVAGVCLGLRP